MGCISKQWVNQGTGARTRSYTPTLVNISAHQITSWGKLRFTARKPNGAFQALYLSQNEVDASVGFFVACASQQSRERVLHGLLRGLSHAKLLKALAKDIEFKFEPQRKLGWPLTSARTETPS